MDYKIAKRNADLLWNILDRNGISKATLNVDNKGQISTIAKWNLVGRLVRWIRDRNGELTKKIHEVTAQTLNCISDYNQEKKLENSNLRFYVKRGSESYWIPNYSSIYPADYLAKRVIVSPLFGNNESIKIAAQKLIDNKDIYPSFANNAADKNDERVLWWDDFAGVKSQKALR